jgi:hypothetical protein
MADIHIQMIIFDNELSKLRITFSKLIDAAENSGRNFKIKLGINPGGSSAELFSEILLIINQMNFADIIEVTCFRENIGHGAGHNKLFFDDKPDEYLILCNPDGAPFRNAIYDLIAILESNKEAVAADAQQFPFPHPKEFNSESKVTPWVSGAMVIVRSAAFAGVNGFDGNFFLHCDDVDLSFRLRLRGGRLLHCQDAIFFHEKFLDIDGQLTTSKNEMHFGRLGSLLLCEKFGFRKNLARMLFELKFSPSREDRFVLAEYGRLKCKMQKYDNHDLIKEVKAISNWQFAKHLF